MVANNEARGDHYDVLIIGSGQAGGPLGTALVAAGKRTALIEREHIGGTCINEGCTPTKTMVASAKVAYLAGRGTEYGVSSETHSVDLRTVRQRKRDIVELFRSGSENSIRNGGVEIFAGEGSFRGPHDVDVRLHGGEIRHLTADVIVLDTGSRPSDPPIDGLSDVPHLNSTSIMELDEVPEHLLILGGGYIAVEFGQMFRRFGSRVTILQRGGYLLEREDVDISEAILNVFRDDGIEVVLNAAVESVASHNGISIEVRAKVKGEPYSVTGSHLLVATGRTLNTEALNLNAAAIERGESGVIRVNSRLETNVPGIYAVGEVAGTPAFTHMSYDDFRIVRDNLLGNSNRTTEGRLVPYTVFTDPQLGRIGLSEREAREANHRYKVARMEMSHVARALESAETRGMVKVLVDPDTEQILGAAVLGMEGGEIMAMLEIAMMGKLPYSRLRDGIFAHPTLAELFNNLFSEVA